MSAVFIKSAYNKLQYLSDITSFSINISFPDKFTLKVFNKLIYDQKINELFIASLLLGLLKHYIISYNVKSINIELFYSCFSKFTFSYYIQTKVGDNFVMLQ